MPDRQFAPHIKALLFDLDGTLCDTASANYQAYAQALKEVDVIIDRNDFDDASLGKNWRQFLPDLLGRTQNLADPVKIAARKQAIYPELIRHAPLNIPLIALLKSTKQMFDTGLVTNASSTSVKAFLALHQLGEWFDIVVTGDDVTHHKPHPEAYLLAAARLEIEPRQCIAFEDSPIGIKSAMAADMLVIRVVLP